MVLMAKKGAGFMKRYGVIVALVPLALTGCKYYGSALPPEYPLSMDDAVVIANDNTSGAAGMQRPIVRKVTRPRVERPSYLPEKELAIVAPPETLLVWTYPHITNDNTRIFGNWSTIFLTDRYQWVHPTNELGENMDNAGTTSGRPGFSQQVNGSSASLPTVDGPAQMPSSSSMNITAETLE